MMHISQENNLSMSFSRTLQEHLPDTVTLSFEQGHGVGLFGLLQDYESFEFIKSSRDEFLLKIENMEFKIRRDTERYVISMINLTNLEAAKAELFVRLFDLLFHDRLERFRIETDHPDLEFLMWEACYNNNIAVKTMDQQLERFQQWTESKNFQEHSTFHFAKPENFSELPNKAARPTE